MGQFPDREKLCPHLVDCTISVYKTITTELLPTPAKSHYTFNLRDLSKVFQGMLMADVNRVKVFSPLYYSMVRKKIVQNG